MQKYVLTFDIDWAPDFAIRKCLDLVDAANCKATFFTTHDTPVNQEIIARGHNLGIHPNFLPGSSQGTTVKEIISECLRYAPDAWCMRTHSLVQSSPLLYELFANFSQLKLDVSLLMHGSPYAHKGKCSLNDVTFDRILYNWEDDIQFSAFQEGVQPELFFGEITVFDFHPIHVFLNSTNGSEYQQLHNSNTNMALYELPLEVVEKFVNKGMGTQSYLKTVLESSKLCIDLGEV